LSTTFVPSDANLENYFTEDSHFRQLYPLSFQKLDTLHWSPLRVIDRAVKFLVNKPNAKILDIGSGSGKFCLAGSYLKPFAFFSGVEQREDLLEYAQTVRKKLGRSNVDFVHKNFTQIDFTEYDNFYFYNSFFENIEGTDKIDDSIAYSVELYDYYNLRLKTKLDGMPAGTRIVTYKTLDQEIPDSYRSVTTEMENQLKFWIKNKEHCVSTGQSLNLKSG
jgi:SAM-dependent methyltransferase